MRKHPNNDDAPQDMASSLKEVVSLATVGISALKITEGLLPQAAGEVEKASLDITAEFAELNKVVGDNKQANEIIARIVQSLQFQDRNTQIMENGVIILRRFRVLLEELKESLQIQNGKVTTADSDMLSKAEVILSGIKLGHLRTNFIRELFAGDINKNLLVVDDETPSEDIELFN
jgi:hypothetical protein